MWGHVFEPATGTVVYTITLTVKAGQKWRAHTSAKPAAHLVADVVRVDPTDPTNGTNRNTYVCATNHTPTNFTTDLAAGRWTLVQTGEVSDSTTRTVTVTAALSDTWAGGKYYVSNDGNYANAPSGFTTQTTLPSLSVANRLVLVNYGNGGNYGSVAVGASRVYVMKDPTSTNKPKMGRMTMGGTGSVVARTDANLGAQHVSGQVDCMYYQNDVIHTDPGSCVLYFDPAVNDPFTNMVRPWFVENIAGDTVNPIAGIYGAGLQPMILGNEAGWLPPYGTFGSETASQGQQHSCRIFVWQELVIGHNWLKGGSTDGIRLALKLPSQGFTEWPTTSASSYASEYAVIANNRFGNSVDNNDWQVDVGPQNDTHAEGIGYVILENNECVNGSKTSTNLLVTGKHITTRGNYVSNAGTLVISTDLANSGGIPSDWRGPYHGA